MAQKNLSKKQQQVLGALDRNIQLCREFMNDWLLFNQILSAYPSPGANKAELENQFLKIKSKLAREHQVLKECLQADYRLDGNTMNIVSGATNLESIYSQSEIAVKKLQSEWHRAFIAINETLGGLDDKRARAAAGQKVFLGTDGVKTGGGPMSEKTKKTLITLVVIIVILGVLVGIPGIRNLYMDAFKDVFSK